MTDTPRLAPAQAALYSEPLLPIEKKLIAWSLGSGLVLLALLAIVSRLWPAG